MTAHIIYWIGLAMTLFGIAIVLLEEQYLVWGIVLVIAGCTIAIASS